jgi:peroxiredoxin
MNQRAIAALLIVAQSLIGQSLSGRRAPGFSLPDSAFTQHDLYDLRGRWVLLVFVKTDSANSKALSQLLEQKKAQWGAKAAVLSVAVTPPDNQVTIAKYAAETKITTPLVFDQGQVTASYFRATPTRPSVDMPHVFAINPQGVIVRDWGELQAGIKTFGAELDALILGGK